MPGYGELRRVRRLMPGRHEVMPGGPELCRAGRSYAGRAEGNAGL